MLDFLFKLHYKLHEHNLSESSQLLLPKRGNQYDTILVGWNYPSNDWIKCNVDGAVRSNGSLATCDGVIRDASGQWLLGFSRLLGNITITLAELQGIYTVLSLAKEKGLMKAHMFSAPLPQIVAQQAEVSPSWSSCFQIVTLFCRKSPRLVRKCPILTLLPYSRRPPPHQLPQTTTDLRFGTRKMIESSSHWSLFDSDPSSIDDLCGGRRESKRSRSEKNGFSIPATSTLMEAQEFGEMMEHVDEVNFALDGLRKGQPLRIRRASLVSLLSICATTQQRRLLRTQGMAKTIVDAILSLSLDDSPSNLAAATLFYILTSDGQDDNLLESPSCVKFLIKLLRPIVSTAIEDKIPKFGSKLLSLRQNGDMLKNRMGRLDSSSVAVFSRVQEILVNCKELKTTCQIDSGVERPELCPKWLALLTMEKACLSAISLDGKTREHGGLDAVFEVTMNCHSDLENWMEDSSRSTKDLRNDKHLKSLTLLLKCLKIMENATFLSKDNQIHLLGMKGKLSPQATPFSFTELIIIVIKILSGNDNTMGFSIPLSFLPKIFLLLDLCLRWSSSAASNYKKPNDPFSMASHDSELDQLRDYKENETLSISSSRKYYGVERASSIKTSNVSQNRRLFTCTQLDSSLSISDTPSTSTTDAYSLNMRNVRFMEGIPVVVLDDSQDPFAFDEDDIAPSKWDILSGKQKRSLLKSISSDVGDEEGSSLLNDCLLTAVKVLMNLTNDNPVGCQQIAAYGGLETMSMLIADHELDFLVAILGLLVNLVEKDGRNSHSSFVTGSFADHALPQPVFCYLPQKAWTKKLDGMLFSYCALFSWLTGVKVKEMGKINNFYWNDEAAVLQGEKEAEKMIVEAYAALLLAFLSTESKSIRAAIADNLPDHNLASLVPVFGQICGISSVFGHDLTRDSSSC
ncbi:Wings apart-like protein [Sesbania bispinosa]|nr:Wings apart-like protein [Sesbania bispinosa]